MNSSLPASISSITLRGDEGIGFLSQWQESLKSRDRNARSTSQDPHQCNGCRNSTVTFEPVDHVKLKYSALPYETGTIAFSLSDVIHAAQVGCHLHRWLLDLLCQKLDDLTTRKRKRGLSYGIKMTISLKSYYKSTMIPNSYIGQNEKRRSEWNATRIITRPTEGAELQHRYQIAKSPFLAEVEVQILDDKEVVLSNTEELFLWAYPDQKGRKVTRGLPCISAPAPIEWNRGSAKSMTFAKECLRKCQESHANCHPLHNSAGTDTIVLPSRLLDIEGAAHGGIVRLVEVANFKHTTNYAVLSYCWGGPQPVSLTETNHSSLVQGIQIEQLAKTVQDATKVCAELQIPYLWVDSLCIKQNDPSDQQRELGKMAMYYENSLITICAASAPSSNTGFLFSNGDAPYDVSPFVMQFQELDRTSPFEQSIKSQFSWMSDVSAQKPECLIGGSTKVQLFRFQISPNPNQPISERAWTFQEMLLSTRILVFASDQLYWCCRESYIGCGGFNSSERIALVRPDCAGPQSANCICGVSLIREIHDLLPDIFTLSQRSGLSTAAQWDMIVENFSARDLSVEGDKLRAFAAVASYFDTIFMARWPDVQYAAGLWYSQENPRSFCRQLLWTSEEPSRARRPKNFRAPSWSWASIDGRVSVFDRYLENIFHQLPSLKVQSVMVEPVSTLAVFGEVKSGILRVSGRLRILNLPLTEETSLNLKLSPDTREDQRFQERQQHFYLLEITPYISREDSPKGLLLAPFCDVEANGIRIFRRIGSFSCSKQSEFAKTCFERCTEASIDIL